MHCSRTDSSSRAAVGLLCYRKLKNSCNTNLLVKVTLRYPRIPSALKSSQNQFWRVISSPIKGHNNVLKPHLLLCFVSFNLITKSFFRLWSFFPFSLDVYVWSDSHWSHFTSKDKRREISSVYCACGYMIRQWGGWRARFRVCQLSCWHVISLTSSWASA